MVSWNSWSLIVACSTGLTEVSLGVAPKLDISTLSVEELFADPWA